MWIAACDDKRDFLEEIYEILKTTAGNDDCITVYQSGVELINAVQQATRPLDMLLLDIEMPGLNGIESAKELRMKCPDTKIIVLTDYIQYSYDCYTIKPYDYMLKPVKQSILKEKIGEIRNIVAYQNNFLHIRTRNSDIFLSYVDILYIKSFKRILTIHTRTSEYQYHLPLKTLMESLENEGFLKIHKSYAVNLHHVKRINREGNNATVTMTNGEIVPVGSRNINTLVSAVIDIKSGRFYKPSD